MSSVVWSWAKRAVFQLDPEKAHEIAIEAVKAGQWFAPLLRLLCGTSRLAPEEPAPVVLGMPFLSRLGLAAGFDKNGEIIAALPSLGFGFAEIGTVTPRPQSGNPRPRLFRDPARQALFNRMGFNNAGSEAVARRVAAARKELPAEFRVGVNIGKNKDTPLEDAASDYRKAASVFGDLADFFVINISSPNTPGLRDLQKEDSVRRIVEATREALVACRKAPPVLLKLAPEVTGDDLRGIITAAEHAGISGWVFTNTLGGVLRRADQELVGGWSGGPLSDLARTRFDEAKALTRLPIVSVGGILSAEEAKNRLERGAELVEIYTGWIYNGPGFPAEIRRKIAEKRP